MPGIFLTLRGPRRRFYRFASLALIAVQGAIALSPLVERRGEVRLGAHAEQDGARHVQAHNESTCALCMARAQTSMPAQGVPQGIQAQLQVVAAPEVFAGPPRAVPRDNLSRAPPLTS
jgi:hypothetical protein